MRSASSAWCVIALVVSLPLSCTPRRIGNPSQQALRELSVIKVEATENCFIMRLQQLLMKFGSFEILVMRKCVSRSCSLQLCVTNANNPWSKMRTHPRFYSVCMQLIHLTADAWDWEHIVMKIIIHQKFQNFCYCISLKNSDSYKYCVFCIKIKTLRHGINKRGSGLHEFSSKQSFKK